SDSGLLSGARPGRQAGAGTNAGISVKNWELWPNGTNLAQFCDRWRPPPTSRIRIELAGRRRPTADMLANPGEPLATRGNRLLGRGDDVVLQVKRLGEERIGVARKPVGRRRCSLIYFRLGLSGRDLRWRGSRLGARQRHFHWCR